MWVLRLHGTAALSLYLSHPPKKRIQNTEETQSDESEIDFRLASQLANPPPPLSSPRLSLDVASILRQTPCPHNMMKVPQC